MENFKDQLKIQNLIIGLCCNVLAVFCFLSAAGEAGIISGLTPAGDSHWQSVWRGFICGATFGLLVLMIIALVRNICALRSEKALKKLYVESNDERSIKIWTSARASAYQMFLLIGIVASVIAGYFSMTVSITIIACIGFASVLGLCFKLYYNIKY